MSECTDRNSRVIIDRFKSNLRFLYNSMPEKKRQEAGLWYDGVRTMVDDRAKKYGYSDASVAAVYAVLSPSADWYGNVYNADRLMEIYSTKQDHKWDDKMEATAKAIWKKPKNPKWPDNTKLIALVKGKTLAELDDPNLKGMWIRTYNEAHDDRSFREVRPDGTFGDVIHNQPRSKKEKQGPPSKARPQSTINMANAVEAIEAKGDRDKISPLLGDKHKVRSFYNNILDPHSANGDVTIDTHAVGAALLTVGGNKSVMVAHNFADSNKGGDTAHDSAVTGLSGTYSLYATAYRELAADLKIEPRQLQSITWVEKRKVLGDDALDKKQQQQVKDLWTKYQTDPSVTLEATQKAVLAVAKQP